MLMLIADQDSDGVDAGHFSAGTHEPAVGLLGRLLLPSLPQATSPNMAAIHLFHAIGSSIGHHIRPLLS